MPQLHNNIQIHNSVLCDSQYSTQYSPYIRLNMGIFCKILSVPQHIVMNLNNVMFSLTCLIHQEDSPPTSSGG